MIVYTASSNIDSMIAQLVFDDSTVITLSNGLTYRHTDDAGTVYGSYKNDIIYGNGGNDIIYSGNGNDTVYGGDGNDTVYAGLGNDIVYGGDGDDYLYADAGDDILYGEDGNDTLSGLAGNDTLYGGEGHDYLVGHEGDDHLYGGNGMDILDGGNGNDVLIGGDGLDTLYGGFGKDVFVFNADSAFNDVDIIKDFKIAEGDVIDIRDILDTIYDPLTDDIADFISFSEISGNTFISIDRDGSGNAHTMQQIAKLENVISLAAPEVLESTGNLLII